MRASRLAVCLTVLAITSPCARAFGVVSVRDVARATVVDREPDPFHLQSEDTPKPAEDPPRLQDEPPKPLDQPPKPQDEPPKPADEPPKPPVETPKPPAETPKPVEVPPKADDTPPQPADDRVEEPAPPIATDDARDANTRDAKTRDAESGAEGLLTDAAGSAKDVPKVVEDRGAGGGVSAAGEPDPRAARDTIVATPVTNGSPLGAFRFDYAVACEESSYRSMLDYLAQAFPDLARVESIGKSRAGRDITLLRAGVMQDADVDTKPAVFVCTSLGAPIAASPNGAIYVAETLLMNARTQVETARLFERCTVYFAPALDPDRAFDRASAASDPAAAARLARNFPAGWDPWGADAMAHGPYPLSEPESRAVASFLAAHKNVCAVVVLDPRATDVVALPAGGSLEEFCSSIAGARVHVRSTENATLIDTPLGPAPTDFVSAVSFVSELCTKLPELACVSIAKEKLRADLWMVDLELVNSGEVSTRGAGAFGPNVEPSVWMQIKGASLVAAAVRRAPDRAFETLGNAGPDGDLTFLGDVDGRGKIDVRLIVSPAADAKLEVLFESMRASRARAEIDLR